MAGSRQTVSGRSAVSVRAASGDSALIDDMCLAGPQISRGRTVKSDEKQIERRLESIIDGEIIPRLALLHQQTEAGEADAARPDAAIRPADYLDEFTALIVKHESDVIGAYVKTLLSKGMTIESLLLELLAPAARKLGRLWEEDAVDFVDVTIATSRLQQIVHQFTLPPSDHEVTEPGRRVLLLPTPSEQHTFGLLMASEFFRRDGWRVWGISPVDQQSIPALVANQWFAAIGFSLSSERLIDTLCSTIKIVREASMNRAAPVIVGGRIFAGNDGLRRDINADMAVTDARDAVRLAEGAYQKSLGRQD